MTPSSLVWSSLVDQIVTTRGFLGAGRVGAARCKGPSAMPILSWQRGQEAYEALQGELLGKPIIFMLKVKCSAIARQTGMDMGTTIVKLEQTQGRKKPTRHVKVEVKTNRGKGCE